jgi:hypothetical protein
MASHLETGVAGQDMPMLSLLLRACAWCRLIEIDGDWLNEETAITALKAWELAEPPSFTHTVCPQCLSTLESRRLSAISPSKQEES